MGGEAASPARNHQLPERQADQVGIRSMTMRIRSTKAQMPQPPSVTSLQDSSRVAEVEAVDPKAADEERSSTAVSSVLRGEDARDCRAAWNHVPGPVGPYLTSVVDLRHPAPRLRLQPTE